MTGYVGFGNDTLNRQPFVQAGDVVRVPSCGHEHTLKAGDDGNDFLLTYKCGEDLYLAAVRGRLIIGVPADCVGSLALDDPGRAAQGGSEG